VVTVGLNESNTATEIRTQITNIDMCDYKNNETLATALRIKNYHAFQRQLEI